jgi:hypothetical protein
VVGGNEKIHYFSGMKNAIILLLLILLGRNECQADVKFLNFSKIDPSGALGAHERLTR